MLDIKTIHIYHIEITIEKMQHNRGLSTDLL